MSFQEAVTTVFTQKYVDFSGRARRSECWFAYLAYFLVAIVASIISTAIDNKIPMYLVDLAAFLPMLGAGVRRLHDTGRSGWWMLIALTVIGIVVLIVFYVTDSESGTNAYGPSPKSGTEFNPAPNANWGQS